MESRLPKPRAVATKRPIASVEMNSQSMKVPEVSSGLLKPVTVGLKAIGKSKSTLNIAAKVENENKPPVSKSFLTRSHTSAAIARNPASKVALKRLAPATNAIEAKRANVKPPVRTIVTQSRPGRPGATKPTTTGKAVGNVTGAGVKVAPKPSKWDLKGRLELITSEHTILKEKHKKCATLEVIVEELRAKEISTSAKIEELENAKSALTADMIKSKNDFEAAFEKLESVKSELLKSEQSNELICEKLRKSEDECVAQKKIINDHAARFESLETNLQNYKITNEELSSKVKSLQSLVHDMDKDRRILHNAIQELKGNIRVFCRVRPRISRESTKTLCSINFIDECTLEVGKSDASDASNCGGKTRGGKQEFTFDKVFPPTATQAHVFEELSMLVQSALEGYNVCVFAYGQTGSGKTHTMEGGSSEETEGMIPRTVRHIFQEMKEFELLGWHYRIEASFLEIYNEHIVDLLDSQQKNHEIRMADSKGNDLYVTNLRVVEIHSPEELHDFLRTAQQNRAVAATFANERSSRSHSVARIRLIGTHVAKDEQSIGNLNLVDLAGSERLKSEEAVRTTETKNINKSLANLGNVILALLKKQDHIPYRNSKLTHLLMPSLGGNSKTLMLLNVSPLDECFSETLNSLRFASNVNSCKTGNVKRTRTIINNSMV